MCWALLYDIVGIHGELAAFAFETSVRNGLIVEGYGVMVGDFGGIKKVVWDEEEKLVIFPYIYGGG